MITLISHTDLSDPQQAKTVASVFGDIVNSGQYGHSTPFADVMLTTEPTLGDGTTTASTTTTTTISPGGGKKQLENLLNVASKLTETEKLNEYMVAEEFDIRMDAAAPVAEILSNKGKYSSNWKQLNQDPNAKGPHGQLQSYKNYLTYITERREEVLDVNGKKGDFDQVMSGNNFGAELFKKTAQDYTALGEGSSNYFQFPDWKSDGWKNVIHKWEQHPESYEPSENVQVPNKLFTGKCETKQVSFVGTILDTFPDPGRKNPR